MNSRVTIGLLVVLVVLAGVAYASNRQSSGAAAGTPTPNAAVFTFTQNDVKTLKITYSGKSVTVEQNSDHSWKLTDPPAPYSDSTHIAGVVADLASLQKDRTLSMGSNSPSTYGLDKPYLTATATLNDNSQHMLVVGSKNPGGSGYYAQIQGQTDLLVVPTIGVDSMAQIVAQPPIATPTPPTTPISTTGPIGSPVPTLTPTP